jgi:hypothetical protein
MTEGEARTKWCPFARVLETGSMAGEEASRVAFNRLDNCDYSGGPPATDSVPEVPELNLLTTTMCIGSACMAWRWVGAFPLPDDPPAISERYHGYCGLAGKP